MSEDKMLAMALPLSIASVHTTVLELRCKVGDMYFGTYCGPPAWDISAMGPLLNEKHFI